MIYYFQHCVEVLYGDLQLILCQIEVNTFSMTMYSSQNVMLILINNKDLPFMHALNKEMLLLKSNQVKFKKKVLEKLVIVCDMLLKRKTEEMHSSLI